MAPITGKAWTYESKEGGIINNLRLTDYEIPDHKASHVLVEVLNVSLNPGDLKFPDIPILKWFIGRPTSICFDFCGRIRAVPSNISKDARNLQVGQIVFGMHRDIKTLGTLKTIMWIHQDAVYPLPAAIPQEHGSALGVAAMTAYQVIVPYAKEGGKVLINGGTGGVGTFCIQIAKALGMHVIATCSEAGVDLCKKLGADETIDYKSTTFHQDLCRTQVDLVIDNVGHDPMLHRRSQGFLQPEGQFVLVGLMAEDWAGIQSMFVSWCCPTWLGGPNRKWAAVFTKDTVDDYAHIANIAGEGRIEVVVDSTFSFEDVTKAFERLKTGRVKGKVMVNIDNAQREAH